MAVLKKGDKGPDVRLLQDRLVDLGFLTVLQQSTGPGVFGPQTEAALKRFQQSQGLGQSGRLTAETAAALAAPAPFTPPSLNATSKAVDTRLPTPGPGYVSYKAGTNGAHQYARASTILTIQGLGVAWQALFPTNPIQVGHLSLKGGAVFKPHKGHRTGLEADIRPFRKDGSLVGVRWNQSAYSQDLTLRFVRLVRNTAPGVRIFFNDPDIVALDLTERVKGHDDHLHLRFAETQ
jgi:hypothetical protein